MSPASQVDGPGRLPTFLIVGAMKSGTTSLLHYLGGHPDVFALPFESRFFDRRLDMGLAWYRAQFAPGAKARAVGESTPDYMYIPHVAPLLASTLPGVRLIAILREPAERAYSQYWHNRARGHEPMTFEEAVAAEPERLAGDGRGASRYSYVHRGMYVEQLQRLREHFSAEALKVVLFEDLRSDPTALVRDLLAFVGVHATEVPRAVGQAKNRFMTYRFPRLREPIRRLPAPLARVAGRLNVRYGAYPPMADATRAELRERFAPANAALAEWLGRDLDAWRR
jgi:hypothetical protein